MSGKIVILEENQDPLYSITPGWNRYSLTGTESDSQKDSAGLIIDRAAYTVYMDGDKIAFPRKEFELLLLLASNPRKVFKREEILRHVWGKDFKPKDSRSLDVHIRMLRKKLVDRYITTIRGVGYKLEK
jgi:two-component system alkaline phosphatase synthesis response regulator PhoP